jgi:hypothetical protein
MAEGQDGPHYPSIDVRKEAMASLVGMYMQNFVFRRAVRNAKDDSSLRSVLDQYGYLKELRDEEVKAVLDFHRQTVRQGCSDEQIYELLIGPPWDQDTHLRG